SRARIEKNSPFADGGRASSPVEAAGSVTGVAGAVPGVAPTPQSTRTGVIGLPGVGQAHEGSAVAVFWSMSHSTFSPAVSGDRESKTGGCTSPSCAVRKTGASSVQCASAPGFAVTRASHAAGPAAGVNPIVTGVIPANAAANGSAS